MASNNEFLSKKLDRVKKSIEQFPAAATTLNSATDQLGKSVGQIDAVLKKFSLGIPTWVSFSDSYDENTSCYYREELGYAKIGGKWGVAVRTVDGDGDHREDQVEQWLFSDAPRLLRVQAVEKIPELLEALLKHAAEMSNIISAKAEEVDALTAAISAAIDPSAKPKVAQRGPTLANPSAGAVHASTSVAAILSDPGLVTTIEEFNRANVLGLDTSVVANAASAIAVTDAIANAASVMGAAAAMASTDEAIFERVAGITVPKSLASAKARK